MISNFGAEVLRHTSNTGRYVTGDLRVLALAAEGLLFDHGPQALAGGDHYLVITGKGRKALNEWQAAQPLPKRAARRRRRSRSFEAWRNYCEACGRISFSEFLQVVWPGYARRAA